jgi:1-acyl-sn-glycerol-3-phosphate acyltransferase
MIERLVAALITGFARLVTGAQARWIGCGPSGEQRIYYANHSSHGDFVLIWTALPAALRARTRPVAARDYWDAGELRRFLIHRVFRGVLVERGADPRTKDPLVPLIDALDRGDSLIIFPEGTRNPEEEMLPFKSGIYHLARQRPGVDLVPVWIENVGRVMPKGQVLPVPLLCSVNFGAPIRLQQDEEKQAFLDRARLAIVELRKGP